MELWDCFNGNKFECLLMELSTDIFNIRLVFFCVCYNDFMNPLLKCMCTLACDRNDCYFPISPETYSHQGMKIMKRVNEILEFVY